jgi:hypothetical protein
VELGGWNFFETWRNPPYQLLEKEIAPLSDFALYQCLASPRLEWYGVQVTSHGRIHHIRAVIHNTGWLPTQVSEQAIKMKVVRQLEADITLPEGAKLVTGTAKTMLGQLQGRSHKPSSPIWSGDATSDRAKVEWVVEADAGSVVEITAVHPRAGTIRQTITLS